MSTLTLHSTRTSFPHIARTIYQTSSVQSKSSFLSFHHNLQTIPLTRSSFSTSSKSQSRINGPESTLPAPLSLPERDSSQALPKYLFTLGKAYLNFYKSGVKAIYYNYKSVKALRQRVPQLANTTPSSLRAAIASHKLDRHDLQLLRRSSFDMKRVPMFALVFAICGEFTPLIVLAVTGIVPYTCRIPKQINGDREKLEKRRKISFRNLTSALPQGVDEKRGKIVDELKRMQLIHNISWSLGLSSSIWDWLGGQYPGLPTNILRRKVAKRVEYLEIDDQLIAKSKDGIKDLSSEEVKIAAVERGIDTVGRKDSGIRQDLEAWAKARKSSGVSIERLLLTRPSVWPSK